VAKDSLLELYRLLQTWAGQGKETAGGGNSLINLYGLLRTRPGQVEQTTEGDGSSPPSTARTAQWVTQADTWLAPAIQQGLLQPIATDALDRWPQLPEPWPSLVRRNTQGQADSEGDVWGIPYRWTPLAILYDQRSLGDKADSVRGWGDLQRSAWNQRLMLPDDERLVIGLALKALGASVNVPDPLTVSGLEDFLAQLHRQVRWYNATHTLKALVIGDATAVVGWLDALLPIAQRYRHLRLVIPAEGTLASADLWVRPSAAPDPSPLAVDWLNFCLSDAFTEQMAIYGQGLTPWHWGAAATNLPPTFQPAAGLLENTAGLANSEFLLPLDSAAQAQFTDLWRRLRTGMIG
jgi:putative spermidine/putrescine transport system substrate-binding protein